MLTLLLFVSLLAFSHADCPTKGRLVLTDSLTPSAYVIDLDEETPSVIATVPLRSTSGALYTTEDGLIVTIVHRANNSVQYLKGGVTVNNDGSVTKADPSLFNYVTFGPRPTHFVSHIGKIAIFFDGLVGNNFSSGAEFITESSLYLQSPIVVRFDSMPTHHGVAIPVQNNQYLISHRNPVTEVNPLLPDGFYIYGDNKQLVFDLNQQDDHHAACQGYHGSGHIGDVYAFGCASISQSDPNHAGILLAWFNETLHDWESFKIQYPDTWVNGRTGTFVENPNKNFFIGNYDSATTTQGLVRITYDSSIKTYEEIRDYEILKPLPYTRCAFGIEEGEGEKVVVLASDGSLYIYENPRDWTIAPAVVSVIPGLAGCRGDALHGDPRMFVGDGFAYVTVSDPATNNTRVIEVDLRTEDHAVRSFLLQNKLQVASITLVGVPANCNSEPDVIASPSAAEKLFASLLLAIVFSIIV